MPPVAGSLGSALIEQKERMSLVKDTHDSSKNVSDNHIYTGVKLRGVYLFRHKIPEQEVWVHVGVESETVTRSYQILAKAF